MEHLNKKIKLYKTKIIEAAKILAMERSPIRDKEIKDILNNALSTDINNREIYMKGIDNSYYYEGYNTYTASELI